MRPEQQDRNMSAKSLRLLLVDSSGVSLLVVSCSHTKSEHVFVGYAGFVSKYGTPKLDGFIVSSYVSLAILRDVPDFQTQPHDKPHPTKGVGPPSMINIT